MSHDEAAARSALSAGLSSLQIAPGAIEPLLSYVDELLRYNPAYRLVAADDATPLRIVERHLLDSLSAVPAICAQLHTLGPTVEPPVADAPITLFDIGSGAGFPGIPLHIALSLKLSITTVLVERMDRRVRFLRATIAALQLKNITVEPVDAFALSRRAVPPIRGVIVFRAVTELNAAFLAALQRIGGEGALLCAHKADPEKAAAELDRVGAPWANRLQVVPIAVPGGTAARSLVLGRL